ncbi:MAG: sensor histidine kinase [Anaerolineales bacterium]|nr:sensor histidine kinase [Anaerolineales bacterium]
MTTPSSAYQQQRQTLPVGVTLIFVLVTLTAYVPTLFASELHHWPIGRLLLFFALGFAYLAMGTKGWDLLVERTHSLVYAAVYFIIQAAIVSTTIWLTITLSNTTWVMMMPIVGQTLVFSWLGSLIISALLLASFALQLLANGASLSELPSTLISLGTGMLFVLIFSYVAIREEAARNEIERLATELQDANRKLREYAIQAEELATTKERNRLAREIHDSLGHYLTVITVQLRAAQAVLEKDPERALNALQKSQQLAQDGLTEVRRSVASLRESPIDNLTLLDAVSELINDSRAAGIVTEFTAQGTERVLSPQSKLTLYRAVQEGLTNARKHAHASRVDIILDFQDPDTTQLTVADNGVGTSKTDGGFGLLGLQERVQLLGGTMRVETAVGAGFHLHISLPT